MSMKRNIQAALYLTPGMVSYAFPCEDNILLIDGFCWELMPSYRDCLSLKALYFLVWGRILFQSRYEAKPDCKLKGLI